MPSRRDHSKSRRGCSQCKNRHIKCDEVPPCCGPCSRKGLKCDYEELVAPLPSSFLAHDMGLMHHYTLYTSLTLGVVDDEKHRTFWQSYVPQLAVKYEFLMFALLSITAAHVAATESTKRPEHLQIARDTYGKALSNFRASIYTVSPDRLEAIFCFSVMVMLLTFSFEVIDHSDNHDSILGIVEVFAAVRTGAQVLPVSFRSPELRDTRVGGLMDHTDHVTPHPIPDLVSSALSQIEAYVAFGNRSIDNGRSTVLREALDRLKTFFSVIALRPPNSALLLQWPMFLSADFLDLLRQRDHCALVMLALWCVPVHNSPRRWFLGDTVKAVVLQIARILEGTVWCNTITWPVAQVTQEKV